MDGDLLVGEGLEWDRAVDGRVVDENVEFVVALGDLREGGSDAVRIADIGGDADSRGPSTAPPP